VHAGHWLTSAPRSSSSGYVASTIASVCAHTRSLQSGQITSNDGVALSTSASATEAAVDDCIYDDDCESTVTVADILESLFDIVASTCIEAYSGHQAIALAVIDT